MGLHEQIGFGMTGGDLSGSDGAVAAGRASSEPIPPVSMPPSPGPTSASASPGATPQDAGQWLDATCPYLRSTDGSWRSVVPQHGQRCWGQQPPAALEPMTQERLCRTQAHTRCEVFVAAEQRHLDALTRDHVSPERLDGRFGVLVRPSTLVLDDSGPVRLPLPLPPGVIAGRRRRVAVGLGLAGLVVIVALLAGLGSGGGPQPTQSPPIAFVSPSPVVARATASPTRSPTPRPTHATVTPTAVTPTAVTPTTVPATPVATPVSTPVATPVPTPTPSPGQSPGIRTTYRVRKGDTLAGIAAKFGVTKKQLLAVNDFETRRIFATGI